MIAYIPWCDDRLYDNIELIEFGCKLHREIVHSLKTMWTSEHRVSTTNKQLGLGSTPGS